MFYGGVEEGEGRMSIATTDRSQRTAGRVSATAARRAGRVDPLGSGVAVELDLEVVRVEVLARDRPR